MTRKDRGWGPDTDNNGCIVAIDILEIGGRRPAVPAVHFVDVTNTIIVKKHKAALLIRELSQHIEIWRYEYDHFNDMTYY